MPRINTSETWSSDTILSRLARKKYRCDSAPTNRTRASATHTCFVGHSRQEKSRFTQKQTTKISIFISLSRTSEKPAMGFAKIPTRPSDTSFAKSWRFCASEVELLRRACCCSCLFLMYSSSPVNHANAHTHMSTLRMTS